MIGLSKITCFSLESIYIVLHWTVIIIHGKISIKKRGNKMEQSRIDRINALYKKQKEEGLTEKELKEQAILRKEYVGLFRKNFLGTLDTIKIQDEKGNIRPFKKSES